MSGHQLREMPVPKVPEDAPAPGTETRADLIDVTNIPDIDEQEHGLDCPCGCAGDALVLSTIDGDGEYIASTVTVKTYQP